MTDQSGGPDLKAAAIDRAQSALFGQPLVTNTVRGTLVEAMIAQAIEPEWRWCSANYASWDFENGKLKLEVKQSASLQTWNSDTGRISACSFDIAYRTQAWEDGMWTKGRRRAAHVYVFAHHPVVTERADHRDPAQWDFYVLATSRLPETTRLSLSSLKRIALKCDISSLQVAIRDECISAGHS